MESNHEPGNPDLAIIIATLGRPAWVRRILSDVCEQIDVGMEVVVVDQSAPLVFEGTARYIASLGEPRIRHVSVSPANLPAARNVGVSMTHAPVVLFLDDDVRLESGCLIAHLAQYDRPALGGVVGRIVEPVPKENASALVNGVGLGGRVRSNLTGRTGGPVASLKGANMSIRREVLEEVGGFDPGYGGTAFLEEADLSERAKQAGWSLWFAPEAGVLHGHAPEGGCRVEGVQTSESWRFRNTGRFWRRNRSTVGLMRVVPTFLLIAVRRGLEWRDPGSVVRLMQSFYLGWKHGKDQTET